MIEKNILRNGWLVVILAYIIFILYPLLSPGMFFDGVTYAAIAENYRLDSFWELHYTETLKYDFYEHPPLAFFLQKLVFTAGFNEIAYGILIGLTTVILLHKVFVLSGGQKADAWLPSVLFIITPVVFWSYSNNMLENTLTIFTLLNVFIILRILNNNYKPYWQILSGVITVFCFLTKGPVGLFPLVILPLHFIFLNKQQGIKYYISHYFFYLIGVILSIALLFYYENSNQFLTHYLNEQVFDSMNGEREIVSNRFFILQKLFLELLVMFGITVILFIIGFKNTNYSNFKFYFSIGCCASLPILISSKQMGFYIVPAMAFYALSFSFLVRDFSQFYKSQKLSLVLYAVVMVSLLIVSISAKHNIRDSEYLALSDFIEEELEIENTHFGISSELKENWALHAYLYRYNKISLMENGDYNYYIIKKNEKMPFDNYKKIKSFDELVLIKVVD